MPKVFIDASRKNPPNIRITDILKIEVCFGLWGCVFGWEVQSIWGVVLGFTSVPPCLTFMCNLHRWDSLYEEHTFGACPVINDRHCSAGIFFFFFLNTYSIKNPQNVTQKY